MAIGHEVAAGMGGIRTAGDLVARMVFNGMRINEAKEYVAGRLKCAVSDLSDAAFMRDLREELDIGGTVIVPHKSYGMAAKIKIAEILGIAKNSAYTLMHSEGFPTLHIGRRLVVPKEKLLQWMDDQLE